MCDMSPITVLSREDFDFLQAALDDENDVEPRPELVELFRNAPQFDR